VGEVEEEVGGGEEGEGDKTDTVIVSFWRVSVGDFYWGCVYGRLLIVFSRSRESHFDIITSMFLDTSTIQQHE
jgi:hypothetical protein